MAATALSGCYPTAKTEAQDDEWLKPFVRRPAEYILAGPNYVAPVPSSLAAKDAVPIICASVTTYKGIKETAAKSGFV